MMPSREVGDAIIERNCENCYYADECRPELIHIPLATCEYFCHIVDELDDEYIEKIINDERKRYYDEYMEYVSEYNDDLFFL